jgi:His/Glu/Gln/Arg/opine family amino acid ABC transporter permease subunit
MAAQSTSSPPKWLSTIFDVRVLQIVGQIAFVILLVTAVSLLVTNVLSALAAQNATPSFGFMQNRAGFDIGESPPWYNSDQSYFTAFVAGLLNTFRIIIAGLVAATVLGIFGGIFLLSNNWLVRTITRSLVEALRNTPLIVQLFVWYFIIMFQLPVVQQSLTFPPESVLFLTLRFFIYVILLFIVYRMTKRGTDMRQAVVGGIFAAIFVIEAGFWLVSTQANWQGIFGRANLTDGVFIVYVIGSLILIAAAWVIRQPLRPLTIGIAVGQFIGCVAFYFGVIPTAAARLEIYPAIYANIRGIIFPEILPTARFNEWLLFIIVGVAIALMQAVYYRRVSEQTGRPINYGLTAFLLVVGFTIVGWFLVGFEPAPQAVPVEQDGQTVLVTLEDARAQGLLTKEDEALYSSQPLMFLLPRRQGFNFAAGSRVSPEYMALFLGLSVYTACYIAEIVRAGIQSVSFGQVEAARSIGLPNSKILRMIVLPQALRVIIPPLGNQYLNLAKNSSLAIAISYADLFLIMRQVMNQSGQSVAGIIIVMLTYLTISLTISAVMNTINRRTRIVAH